MTLLTERMHIKHKRIWISRIVSVLIITDFLSLEQCLVQLILLKWIIQLSAVSLKPPLIRWLVLAMDIPSSLLCWGSGNLTPQDKGVGIGWRLRQPWNALQASEIHGWKHLCYGFGGLRPQAAAVSTTHTSSQLPIHWQEVLLLMMKV